MAITVKHSKVSTIPDGDDSSLIRPSDWNDDHVLTGTVPVANGGTGTNTLTGYVIGNGTAAMTASATIPNTDITGLGTMSTQNANNVNISGGSISGTSISGYIPTSAEGVPNGVATLDSGGKVPVSQIPALGDLNYQGTWNASTNSPTLTSSTGTKGYYYVVSVAGTTNLDGITDWQVGDWAVFNGTVWQKIDNTDAVTSVNGYTGAVVLTYSDVGAANAPVNTNITSMTGITGGISTADYVTFDTTYATTLTAGQLGWDGNNTLGIGMAGGNVVQHIGEDQFFYCKASSAITKGQVVMFTGAVGASGVPTGAPATGITDGTYIMGVAAESIATNDFGLVQTFGTLRNINTSGYADGDILWYNPAVAGGLTKTKPSAPNVKVQMAAVINGGSSGGGTILIRIDPGSTLGGTDSNAQITTPSNGQILTYDGTATYWKNTSLTAGSGISVTPASDGTLTIANTSPSSGGTVTSITAGTGLNGGTITTSGTISLANTTVSSGSYTNASITVDAQGRLTSASSGTAPVTSVGATSPVVSSGGTTPTISMPAATASVNGYLTSADWTTFNSKQPAGTYVTSVSGTTGRITSSGGTTPAIDLESGIVTAGTTGSSSLIPVVTVDTYGRVTAITTAANPQGTVTSVSGTGTVSGITLTGTVTSSGSLTLGGSLDLSSPPAIGGTTPAAITGTTITATKFVGVSGGTF